MIPAVANGVVVNLVRPGDGAVANRVIDPLPIPITFNGFVPALAPLLTLSGTPASATLFSVTTVNGFPVVLVGAVVTTSDGFVGAIGPQHGAGPSFDLQ